MDYTSILKKENKAIKLLKDYFTVNSLFKAGGTKMYKVEDITKDELLEFLNKFYLYDKASSDFKSYNKDKEEEFYLYFELDYNSNKGLYNTLICLINDLLVIIDLKEKKKNFKALEITFNDKNFNIQVAKKYKTYYLIIDNIYPLFFTDKEKVIGNISLNNNKYWYSYLDSIKEEYLKLNKWSDKDELCNLLIEKYNIIKG